MPFGAGAQEERNAQTRRGASVSTETELPVRRIALFSSGVGYFEHSGSLSGNAELSLSFDVDAVNDALKSLVISDAAPGASPSVSYPSEETLERTLQSLKIDLSRSPGTAEIFSSQRGAEIEVTAPNPVSGRILGVEYRDIAGSAADSREAFLSLSTAGGVRIIALKDIASFSFKDPALNADLKRALDLIAANRASRTRQLLVRLPGGGNRRVSLSYVIAVPVWKVSYRLDLGQSKPLFQGWAIVDNNGDTDWDNVELSLVSGRPVSFIQQLYPPYYFRRPTLPLAIAGTAQARTHDSGYDRGLAEAGGKMDADFAGADMMYYEESEAPVPAAKSLSRSALEAPQAASNVSAVQAAASGSATGDQFAFTVKNPVTLPRRQSAMIPLVNGSVEALKSLVLSGGRAANGTIHPELAAELTNTTGVKLPAGPITVFDGGNYAGDALIEFFSENDKRFISYGEDLSVSGFAATALTRPVSSVTVSAGVMTINRRLVTERTYTVRNAAAETKRLIIEHPVTFGAVLTEPKNYLEKTDSLYRFVQNLPGGREITFRVQEEAPLAERIVLANLRFESMVSYSTSQEIPASVRAALVRAVELRQKADAAKEAQAELESRRSRLIADQDRVRNNLSAVGSSSDLGREYMKRMTDLDRDIENLAKNIDAAGALVQSTRKDVENYIAGLKL
jgi:hypothetical protein